MTRAVAARSISHRRPNRDAWLIAWALTLLLHLAGVLGLRRLPPLVPASNTSHAPQPIRLVFNQSDTRRNDEPRFYSSLPPDRADEAPKKADFLSNVTSRARDLVPGGDDALPRMQGEGDAPMVQLEPDGAPSRPTAAAAAPQASEPATPRSAESWRQSILLKRDPVPARTAGGANLEGDAGSPGSSDIRQLAMANPDGNAALTGDVSLNTTAWDYAPWLERFRIQLMDRWYAPPAYMMGILKEGGWAVIEVEITRSGKMLRLDLLEEQGHPSLIRAAQSALRSMAPIESLPADFPEPTLVLRIRMIYPKLRPR